MEKEVLIKCNRKRYVMPEAEMFPIDTAPLLDATGIAPGQKTEPGDSWDSAKQFRQVDMFDYDDWEDDWGDDLEDKSYWP